jgi:hypothetical protein
MALTISAPSLMPPKNRTSKSFGSAATSAEKSVWPGFVVQRVRTAPPVAGNPFAN